MSPRADHTFTAQRVLRALHTMANPEGVVVAPVAVIAAAAALPTTRTSQALASLRAKRLVERVQDGRGGSGRRTIYRVRHG